MILSEAKALVNGDRSDRYGPPWDDHERAAAIYRAILGDCAPPDGAVEVQFMMMAVKLARLGHAHRAQLPPEDWRDSLVDLAGYADCMWQTLERL